MVFTAGSEDCTFGGHAGPDLNIWLLYDHTTLQRLATSSSILGSQDPFAIRVGESANWDDADASRVIAAITRAEANTPPRLL